VLEAAHGGGDERGLGGLLGNIIGE